MLSLLGKQLRRWLDYMDQLDYYRENPRSIGYHVCANYRQVTAAVESDPCTYALLVTSMRETDTKHNHRLLRLAVEKDPKYIAYHHDPKTIPVDLLYAGLQSEYIWKMILDNWGAYDNPEFIRQFPEEAGLVHFYKQMGLSADECVQYYNARRNNINTPDSSQDSLLLPDFQ